MAEAQVIRENHQPSHSVSLEWRHGNLVATKEEVYIRFTAEWRGQTYNDITMRLDRYVASNNHGDVWTPWRAHLYHAPDRHGLSLLAQGRIREAALEECERYPYSGEYVQSRRKAFANAIRNEIRETRSDVNLYRPEQVLTRYEHELTSDDAAKLWTAMQHLRGLLKALEV